MKVWLLSVDALNASNQPVTLRFSSGAYRDPLAHGYLPRIEQPALFKAAAFGGSVITGSSRSGYGEARLRNDDGRLDYLVDYAVDGRAFTLQLDTDGVLETVLVATVQRMDSEGPAIVIRLRDPQEALDKAHPYTVYAGSNVLPDGVEGTSDIKGQRKPRVYGRVSNAAPVLVNTTRYIYQASDLPGTTITAVRDRGVPLTVGAPYVSVADMLTAANAPAAGAFRAYQGYFRLGAVPVGEVTCDPTSTVTTLGAVMAQIATDAGTTLSPADATALDAVGEVGLYLAEESTTSALIDRLALSAGGYWGFNAASQLRAGVLLAPAAPTFALSDYDVIQVDRTATGAGANGLPIWRVVVKCDPVQRVQTDLAAAALSTAGRWSQPYRQAIAESPAVLTRNPLASELVIETALCSLADGQTLANRLLGLLSVPRHSIDATARLRAPAKAALQLGACGTLRTKKGGYQAGRDERVLGFTLDAQRDRAVLSLWG